MRIETERLVLRPFAPDDLDAFAAINADPAVMAHFLAPMTREKTAELLARIAASVDRTGYGFAAVERRSDGALIGMAGLSLFQAPLPWTPATEIGWRLTPSAWGQGYATEAARAWLAHGFGALGLDRIVAFTTTTNAASEKVMQRLGMTRTPDLDFDHPAIPAGHRLSRHIVYTATPT